MDNPCSKIGVDEVEMSNAIQTRFVMPTQAVEHGHQATESRLQRRIIGVREAAQYLGRTEKSIRHLVQRRKLRCIRADGRVMFDLVDLNAWIDMNRS
jgi:hypothetical protein